MRRMRKKGLKGMLGMEERHGCLSASHTDWVNSPWGGAHLISLSLPAFLSSPTASSLFIYESIFSTMTRIQKGGRRWCWRRRLHNRRGEGGRVGQTGSKVREKGCSVKKQRRDQTCAYETEKKQIHSYILALMRRHGHVYLRGAPND